MALLKAKLTADLRFERIQNVQLDICFNTETLQRNAFLEKHKARKLCNLKVKMRLYRSLHSVKMSSCDFDSFILNCPVEEQTFSDRWVTTAKLFLFFRVRMGVRKGLH